MTTETTTETERCLYCDAILGDATTVPNIKDDEGWAELAEAHFAGCEWITTRAHRVFEEDGRKDA